MINLDKLKTNKLMFRKTDLYRIVRSGWGLGIRNPQETPSPNHFPKSSEAKTKKKAGR